MDKNLDKPGITDICIVHAAASGLEQTYNALRDRKSGLVENNFPYAGIDTWIGKVDGLEVSNIPESLSEFDCRNHRLAQKALDQGDFKDSVEKLKSKYGTDRIAVITGTTTSGIYETELAYSELDKSNPEQKLNIDYRHKQNLYALTDYVKSSLGISGPGYVISTACSSSTKVFISAYRLIKAGFADAAIVGGVDSLCLTTLYGFSSLDIVSKNRVTPCDRNRAGINIGEAGGFAILEKNAEDRAIVNIAGYGESSDAYHTSTPHPDGEGAYRAMKESLEVAGLTVEDIDYIHMHGTGTPSNDKAEDRAIYRLFGKAVPASSTKSWTGHTLGAAGITGVAMASVAILYNYMPGILFTHELDPELQSDIRIDPEEMKIDRVMVNSFGFGGTNSCLIIERAGL